MDPHDCPDDRLGCAPAALYVYYRVPVAKTAAARLAVGAMLQQLQVDWPGLQAMWMRKVRSAERDDAHCTWMEVYTHPDGVTDACMHAIETEARQRLGELIGERHTEVFVPHNDGPATTT